MRSRLTAASLVALIALVVGAATACGSMPSAPEDAAPRAPRSSGFLGGVSGGGGTGAGTGTVTNVTGGTGVTITSPTTTPNIALDNTVWQARLSSIPCAAGSYITTVAAGGAATCTAAVNAVTGGSGITLAGSTLNTDTTVLQSRVTGTAAAGSAITSVNQNGTVGTGVFVNAAGTGLSLTGSSLAVNVTGGTCANNQVVTSVSATGVATCGSVVQNDYVSTSLEWKDDWMEFFVATATQGYSHEPYQLANVGTGAQWNDVTGVTGRPGIIEQSSGTTATAKLAAHTSANAISFGDGSWDFVWVGGVRTLSTGTDEYGSIIGFYDVDTSLNQVDGCYFLYDRGNVATSGTNTTNLSKLSCWCAQNSTRTTFLMDGSTTSNESFVTVNAPVAALTYPNTNILNLEVRMTGTTRAEFFVNGVKSCDINTNIPSGSARLTAAGWMSLKSAGTTSTTELDTDYTDLKLTGMTARSP